MTHGSSNEGNTERVKVYVRIRPLTEVEKGRGEDQVCLLYFFWLFFALIQLLPINQGPLKGLCSFFKDCVALQNEEALLLKAPKESHHMKTAERGIGPSMHKFSFSKVGGSFHMAIVEYVYIVNNGEIRIKNQYWTLLIFDRFLDQRPHSSTSTSTPWWRWWRMCFREKTGSSILMGSPILEKHTPSRVRCYWF